MASRFDAGVRLVVGNPGHGKSFYAVRLIVSAVLRDMCVATNIALMDGWEETVARMGRGLFLTWRIGILTRLRARARLERALERRRARERHLLTLVHPVRDMGELRSLRLPACGKCRSCKKGFGCQQEGRGLAVLDEAHQWMNRRTWNIDDGTEEGDEKPVIKRKRILEFFTKHRKRGWTVVLITQSEKLIDSQISTFYETWTKLKNLRRVSHFLNPFFWARINLFVAVTYWGADRHQTRLGTKWFLLSKKVADLYDTMAAFALIDEDDEIGVWPWGYGRGPLAIGHLALAVDRAGEGEEDELEEDEREEDEEEGELASPDDEDDKREDDDREDDELEPREVVL